MALSGWGGSRRWTCSIDSPGDGRCDAGGQQKNETPGSWAGTLVQTCGAQTAPERPKRTHPENATSPHPRLPPLRPSPAPPPNDYRTHPKRPSQDPRTHPPATLHAPRRHLTRPQAPHPANGRRRYDSALAPDVAGMAAHRIHRRRDAHRPGVKPGVGPMSAGRRPDATAR